MHRFCGPDFRILAAPFPRARRAMLSVSQKAQSSPSSMSRRSVIASINRAALVISEGLDEGNIGRATLGPSLPLLDLQNADHASLVMSGDQTGVFEFARLGKLPENLACLLWLDGPRVRVAVLHFRVLLHHFRML